MKSKTYKLLRNINQPVVVVLGIDTLTGLSIVRSLGLKRIPVIGVSSYKFALGAFSKYCTTYEFCPTDEDTLYFLREAGKASKYKNIIFCESDKYLLFLDKYKSDLEGLFLLTIPSSDIALTELMDKRTMLKLAKGAGLDVPVTFFSDEISENKIIKEIPYPCFIKPIYTQTDIRTKGEIAENKNQLEEILLAKRFKSGYLLQEIVKGPEVNIWKHYGYRNNYISYGITYYKVRQIPKDFGVGVVAISSRNREIEKLANKFLEYINYKGLFEIEFKKDTKDEKYKFGEINPRVCAQNELAISLGLNLPYIAYLDALGIQVNPIAEQKNGVLWIAILDYFISCVKYYCKSDKLIFIDWIKQSIRADSYAVLNWRDINPFIFDILSHLFKINPKKKN